MVEIDGMVCGIVELVNVIAKLLLVAADAAAATAAAAAAVVDAIADAAAAPSTTMQPPTLNSSSAKSSSDCGCGSDSASESRGGPSSSYTLSNERYGSGPGDEHTNNGGERAIGYPLGKWIDFGCNIWKQRIQ